MNYNSTCRSSCDVESVHTREKQSSSQADYQLFNPMENKKYDNVRDCALDHYNLFAQDGYGTGAKKIDADSMLRNGALLTNNGHKFSYNALPIMMPYRGSGQGDPVVERCILDGEPTGIGKPCNSLAGVDWYNLTSTPQIGNIQSCMQDPKHIIPEDTDPYWVRGGIPSRTAIRLPTTKRFPWEK
tara:strand:- start:1316 stop:1870 length:555 start_codon:yes stop_codon:yes gene_type:complete